jgi:excisionase family DNA binding protein
MPEHADSHALTLTEAADLLGCHKRNILNLISRGDLPAFDIAPDGAKRRRLRVTRAALDGFVQSREVPRPAPVAAVSPRRAPNRRVLPSAAETVRARLAEGAGR